MQKIVRLASYSFQMVKLRSIIIIAVALAVITCGGERADDQLRADEIAIYLELAPFQSTVGNYPARRLIENISGSLLDFDFQE
jgi:hypothetical protein